MQKHSWKYIIVVICSISVSFANSDDVLLKRLQQVGTERISDAFDTLKIKNKVITGIKPLSDSMTVCGRAYTVLFANIDDPRPAIFTKNRFYLDAINQKNSIIVIENAATHPDRYSVWGALVSRYAKQSKGILGTITNGYVRDAQATYPYPVFSSGYVCSRSEGHYKIVAIKSAIKIKDVTINSGDYVLADRSGIVVISPSKIDKVLLLAEKNVKNEAKIITLIDKKLSIAEIDAIMTHEVSKKSVTK